METKKEQSIFPLNEHPGRKHRPMKPIHIEYGKGNTLIDITIPALRKCHINGKIVIPAEDVDRDAIFGDPLFGTLKEIIIHDDINGKITYKSGQPIDHDVDEKHPLLLAVQALDVYESSNLYLKQAFEGLLDDYNMRLLSSIFISPTSKVLQLGATSNSCTISALLEQPMSQLVILEPWEDMCSLLASKQVQNKKISVVVHKSILLKDYLLYDHLQETFRKIPDDKPPSVSSSLLLSSQKNKTFPKIPEACEFIQTTSFDAIQARYGMYFDTLVINQKNTFYYALQEDAPSILGSHSLETILIANDFIDESQMTYVKTTLALFGFVRVIFLAHSDIKHKISNHSHFYECWIRRKQANS